MAAVASVTSVATKSDVVSPLLVVDVNTFSLVAENPELNDLICRRCFTCMEKQMESELMDGNVVSIEDLRNFYFTAVFTEVDSPDSLASVNMEALQTLTFYAPYIRWGRIMKDLDEAVHEPIITNASHYATSEIWNSQEALPDVNIKQTLVEITELVRDSLSVSSYDFIYLSVKLCLTTNIDILANFSPTMVETLTEGIAYQIYFAMK